MDYGLIRQLRLSANLVACVCRWDPRAGSPATASPESSSHGSWLHPQARTSLFPSDEDDHVKW
jgi:hypothetical protein